MNSNRSENTRTTTMRILYQLLTSAVSARLAAAAAERDNEKGKCRYRGSSCEGWFHYSPSIRTSGDDRVWRANASTTSPPKCRCRFGVSTTNFRFAHMFNTHPQSLYEQLQSSFNSIAGSKSFLFGALPPTSTTCPATYYRGPSSFTSYATNSHITHF